MEKKFASKEKPCLGKKYEKYQATDWFLLLQAFEKCTSFVPSERPSASEITAFISGEGEISNCVNVPLSVSQTTAVATFDRRMLAEDRVGVCLNAIIKDGTNSCAFFCLQIADYLLRVEDCPLTEDEWKQFASPEGCVQVLRCNRGIPAVEGRRAYCKLQHFGRNDNTLDSVFSTRKKCACLWSKEPLQCRKREDSNIHLLLLLSRLLTLLT